MPEHLSPSPGLPGSAAGAHHSGAALGPRSGFWVREEGGSRHGAVGVWGHAVGWVAQLWHSPVTLVLTRG